MRLNNIQKQKQDEINESQEMHNKEDSESRLTESFMKELAGISPEEPKEEKLEESASKEAEEENPNASIEKIEEEIIREKLDNQD